jgi:hypothetical protein
MDRAPAASLITVTIRCGMTQQLPQPVERTRGPSTMATVERTHKATTVLVAMSPMWSAPAIGKSAAKPQRFTPCAFIHQPMDKRFNRHLDCHHRRRRSGRDIDEG